MLNYLVCIHTLVARLAWPLAPLMPPHTRVYECDVEEKHMILKQTIQYTPARGGQAGPGSICTSPKVVKQFVWLETLF